MLNNYEYFESAKAATKFGFYTLIAAAMRNADSDNLEKLKEAFPETYQLLKERHNNPSGASDIELQQKAEEEIKKRKDK